MSRRTHPIEVVWADIDASVDGCTDVRELCSFYAGSIQFCPDGLDGVPLVTLEVSNVNEPDKFVPYSSCAQDTEIDGVVIGETKHVVHRYYRLCVKANGNTTGTIDVNWFLKGL